MEHNRTSPVKLFALSFFRRPLNIVLLAIIPPAVIYGYGFATQGIPPQLIDLQHPANYGRINGALFATAFLTGIFGLFQVIGAYNADRRLAIVGFSRLRLLATRLTTILGVSVFVAAISFVVFSQYIAVAAPIATFGALVLAGLMYGLLGVLLGSIVPRELEGSLMLVFVVDSDTIFSSGLIEWGTFVAKLFPLYYPNRLLKSAAFEGTINEQHLLFAIVYILVLSMIVTGVFNHVMSEGGGAFYE